MGSLYLSAVPMYMARPSISLPISAPSFVVAAIIFPEKKNAMPVIAIMPKEKTKSASSISPKIPITMKLRKIRIRT
jgi:hypothetical protein